MPDNNLTIYGKKGDGDSVIYYVEYDSSAAHNIGKQIHDPYRTYYPDGWNLTKEDDIDIPGFTFKEHTNPVWGWRDQDKWNYKKAYIYYTRNNYKIEFVANSIL